MKALALKYRPKSFVDLVGQIHAAQSLKNAIEYNKVAHAYLFTGSRGVGKTSTARILARSLNCKNGPTVTPCGICDSCQEIEQSISMDVIEMDAASNRGIENIRDLREKARFAPMRDRFKIYIIDEVHMLTNEAFNALLKTLEEPPGHIVFVMATTEQQKVPETILSRCQLFTFKKFSHDEIKSRLNSILDKEGVLFEENSLLPVIIKAEGSMRDALSLLDQLIAFAGTEPLTYDHAIQVLGFLPLESLFEFSEALRSKNTKSLMLQIEKLYREGKDLKRFLWDSIQLFKEFSLIKQDISHGVLLCRNALDTAKSLCNRWDSHELIFVFDILYRLYSNWALFQTLKSSEVRVSIEMAIIEIIETLRKPSVSEVMGKINALQSAISSGKAYEDPKTLKSENPIKPEIKETQFEKKENTNSAMVNQVEEDISTLLQREFMAIEDEEESQPLFKADS
jgi:DNA polymerase III subunit gamma/tau